MSAEANPARTNPTLVDTKGLGKPPPLKNTENEFVSWARRADNFVVSVHPGARDVLTWAVEGESATVTEVNAATEVVMPLDTLRMLADRIVHSVDDPYGRRIVRHPRGLWIWRRSGSLAASTQTLGLEEREDCSEKSFRLDVPSWSSCKEQWNDLRT